MNHIFDEKIIKINDNEYFMLMSHLLNCEFNENKKIQLSSKENDFKRDWKFYSQMIFLEEEFEKKQNITEGKTQQERGNLDYYVERKYFPQNPLNIDEDYWYVYKYKNKWRVCIINSLASDTAWRCQNCQDIYMTLQLGKKRPLVGIIDKINYDHNNFDNSNEENIPNINFHDKCRTIRQSICNNTAQYISKGTIVENDPILSTLFKSSVFAYFSVEKLYEKYTKGIKNIMPISLIPYCVYIDPKTKLEMLSLQLDQDTHIVYERFYGGLGCCGHGNYFYINNDPNIYKFFDKYQHKNNFS